jgi:predicted SprT family Zn-dependent metalloprotease
MEVTKYYFVCDCGQKSEHLENYFRIPDGQRWVCKDCKEDKEITIIKDNIAGGALATREDF